MHAVMAAQNGSVRPGFRQCGCPGESEFLSSSVEIFSNAASGRAQRSFLMKRFQRWRLAGFAAHEEVLAKVLASIVLDPLALLGCLRYSQATGCGEPLNGGFRVQPLGEKQARGHQPRASDALAAMQYHVPAGRKFPIEYFQSRRQPCFRNPVLADLGWETTKTPCRGLWLGCAHFQYRGRLLLHRYAARKPYLHRLYASSTPGGHFFRKPFATTRTRR